MKEKELKLFPVHGKATWVFNGYILAENPDDAWDRMHRVMAEDAATQEKVSVILTNIDVEKEPKKLGAVEEELVFNLEEISEAVV